MAKINPKRMVQHTKKVKDMYVPESTASDAIREQQDRDREHSMFNELGNIHF
jgi:hypothetical protein